MRGSLVNERIPNEQRIFAYELSLMHRLIRRESSRTQTEHSIRICFGVIYLLNDNNKRSLFVWHSFAKYIPNFRTLCARDRASATKGKKLNLNTDI